MSPPTRTQDTVERIASSALPAGHSLKLGARRIRPGVWSFAVWGPHVNAAWVALKGAGSEPEQTRRFPLHRVDGDDIWATCLTQLPESSKDLAAGAVLYCFVIDSSWNDCFHTEGAELWRRDPYARQTEFHCNWCYMIDTHGLEDPAVEAPGTDAVKENTSASAVATVPQWNELVIYELHVGTFTSEDDAAQYGSKLRAFIPKIPYIKSLGFTAIQFMPLQEFGGMWGYNPRLTMSVHGPFGTAADLKCVIRECHKHGLAVIVDIVLNHGSAKLNSLWCWDGYGPHGNGGIYFEGGGETTWGKKFAFHKPQVRAMLLDSADVFLEDYDVDGLRFDSIHNMPDDLLREMMQVLHTRYPKKIMVAEVTPENPRVCSSLGFNSCWVHANYYDAIKVLRGDERDHHWDMVRAMACGHRGFNVAHNSVVSTLGSHDQAGNRHPHGHMTDTRVGRYFVDIAGGRDSWDARARCRFW